MWYTSHMKLRQFIVIQALCLAVPAFAAPFGDGERVVFRGDSITHGGLSAAMMRFEDDVRLFAAQGGALGIGGFIVHAPRR